MALIYENQCCDCATPAYPCRGRSCPRRRVPVHICDKCGCEIACVETHEVDGLELCDECYGELYWEGDS